MWKTSLAWYSTSLDKQSKDEVLYEQSASVQGEDTDALATDKWSIPRFT